MTDNQTPEQADAEGKAQIAALIAEALGTEDALDDTDSITATLIIEFLAERGAVIGLRDIDKLAIAAIVALATDHPDVARQLAGELVQTES